MKLFKQKNEVGNKKVAYFISAVVENQCSPLFVFTDAWITMLIEMGSIKEGQSMGIFVEVSRDPIDDHADSLSVTAIDKGAELVRGAVTAGRGIPAGHLVAPRSIKGMLGDRHQFDVGKASLFNIWNQAI